MEFIARTASFVARSLGLPPASSVPLKYGQIRTMEEFLSVAPMPLASNGERVSVDLGCGRNPRNPLGCERLFGLDIEADPGANVLAVDLFVSPLPFGNQSVDVVTAYDFLEHVPRCAITAEGTRFPFIDLMSEVVRILRPGGLFFSKTPAYPFSSAFVDPTHVNVITEDTFPSYFCCDSHYPQASRYGFKGEFKLVRQRWWGRGLGTSLLCLLQKAGPSCRPIT
jgi:SAM-dependent methyltransferase